MAKAKLAKPGVKKGQPKARAKVAQPKSKLGLLKKAAVSLLKAATKTSPAPKPSAKTAAAAKPPAKGAAKGKAGREERAAPVPTQKPRATKLPPVGPTLNKREMEQILTVGEGRGVQGEGSVKGRLVLKDGLPHLMVTGRDKRELDFLLQGPDQEVLPAYVEHKVSVTGLIKKITSVSGSIDVRKYSAKKPEGEQVEAPVVEQKLRYLSPGEVEQVCNAGMGAGMRGFGTLRGNLELTGEDFFLVVSNGGTRQQVSFLLSGKVPKSFRKNLGQAVQVTGVAEKSSGWGGSVQVETIELRPNEFRAVSRDSLEMVHVEASGQAGTAEVKLNHGITVRLPERAGYTWAIEPTMAKRVGLREANFELPSSGTASREFFFTPRNPGTFEVEFFLAKAFTPAQVSKSYKLNLTVRP